jgi:hypothetical protein
MKLVCFFALLGLAPAYAGTLTLIPADGNLAGPPGSTLGWGYTIENDSDHFLQPMDLSAGVFAEGVPDSIFDFPVLAPHTSLSVIFSNVVTSACAAPPCGLFELVWSPMAVPGFSVSGMFVVRSEYFSAPPDNPDAIDLGPAADLSAPYTATVTGSTTAAPEPSMAVLAGVGLMVLSLCRRRPRSG